MEFDHRWLGRIGYDEAHALQRELLTERAEGRGRDTLLTLEHDPVMTLGRTADPRHLLLAEADYAARGIAVRHVERGGEVTYHGPGHLVMYPIVALREGSWSTLIAPGREHGELDEVPIAVVANFLTAIRDHLRSARDLAPFELINPCGHAGVVSTSIALEQDWAATARGDRDAIGATSPDLQRVADLVAAAYQGELATYRTGDSIPANSAVPAAAGGSR